MKILHIISYPRSGSTILGIAFGQYKEATYLGEVSALFTHTWKRNCGCSINQPVPVWECPLWGPILTKCKAVLEKNNLWDESNLGLLKEKRSSFLATAYRQLSAGKRELELNTILEILNIVFPEASRLDKATLVIDSSKDLDYFRILNHIFTERHVPLHVLRDSRGVVYSGRKNPAVLGKATPLTVYRSSRIALGWGAKNLLIEQFIKKMKGPSFQILYEDWCSNPQKITDQLMTNLLNKDQIDSPFNDEASFNTAPCHSFFGNRSRKSSGVLTIKSDQSWREKMQKKYKIASTMASAIFLKKYGYKLEN